MGAARGTHSNRKGMLVVCSGMVWRCALQRLGLEGWKAGGAFQALARDLELAERPYANHKAEIPAVHQAQQRRTVWQVGGGYSVHARLP